MDGVDPAIELGADGIDALGIELGAPAGLDAGLPNGGVEVKTAGATGIDGVVGIAGFGATIAEGGGVIVCEVCVVVT